MIELLVRIQNYSITDVIDSIKLLLDMAVHSPEVRQHALEITQSKDRIAAIYDWMKTHMEYVSDPVSNGDIELFMSPVKLVENYNQGLAIGGDCDDCAIFATGLFRSLGIKSNVVLVDSAGNGLDHAYCQAWSDKLGWIICDPTSDYPLGWEFPFKERIIVE